MNEVIKRRLAGATVLIGIAFVGVSLLPRMNVAPAEDSVRIVVIDLGAPEPTASVPAIAATPPTLAAVDDGAPAEQTGSDEDSGDIADPGAAPPVEALKPMVAAAAKPPQPMPSAELPSPAPAPAPTPAQRGLKLSESITVAPVRPAEVAAPAALATQDPAPTAGGRWYVQVGGFADIRNAHQAQDRLRAVGQASIIAPMESAQGTLYRVRAGPFPSREAALAAQTALAGAGFSGSALIAP